ncbi:hypothetical protein KSP39_PZI013089 [Platanthera zijinensis]|uniref:Uncharacterized protein n=1 Tax=Platanthera zijinensis TaxID=2320716 RepID=A0AAP0BBQ5_9ASPA
MGCYFEPSVAATRLILDSLSFSSAVISSMIKSPPLGEKVDMLIIENFIFEILSLTKSLILEFKRIYLIFSEALKLGQVVLDSAIKLCRAYYQAIRCNSHGTNVGRKENPLIDKENDHASHIIGITVYTIRNLFEIGTFAASAGGRLVTLLNISWKGVVCLLQLDKDVFLENVNVGEIILTLLSLTVDSLRCAAETWSASSTVTAPMIEAKRIFLPIKFYLINSVRISSEYPCNAMNICKEVVRCVVLISALCIILSKEVHLKAVSEAMVELLEPTSYLLLHTLLNSAGVKFDSKLQILAWIFPSEMDSCTLDLKKDICITELSVSLDSVFDVCSEALPVAESLLLGKVYLSLNLFKASSSLREEIKLEISRKLDNLLTIFKNEDVYSTILGLQIPILSVSVPPSKVIWQPMYSFVLTSLKAFMIVANSSTIIWSEMKIFLLRNIFHPHFLCLEIVKELVCFLIRHAENDMVNQIFEKLFLLMKAVASSKPSISPSSALRRMARSVSYLLSYAKSSVVDQVYSSIVIEDKSDLSSLMFVALLMEGFPLSFLSHKFKIIATKKIVSAFVSFIEINSKVLGMDAASLSRNSGLLGLPVHALSSALCSGLIQSDLKGVKLRLGWATSKRGREGPQMNGHDFFAKLLDRILATSSILGMLCALGEEETIIMHLTTSIFVEPDPALCQCLPHLATFLAGLSHIQIAEDDKCPISAAILELYHSLLRERHWALIHLALSAFGYFAARTPCTQLWRFVPHDAALSFDSATGSEANYDNFMTELKGFLEKEGALCEAPSCKEQLFCEGMELLQNGLETMRNALSQSDSLELKEEFAAHVSCLRDVISQLKKERKKCNGCILGMACIYSDIKSCSICLSVLILRFGQTPPEGGEIQIRCLERVVTYNKFCSGSHGGTGKEISI